jgi:hypothetical protein
VELRADKASVVARLRAVKMMQEEMCAKEQEAPEAEEATADKSSPQINLHLHSTPARAGLPITIITHSSQLPAMPRLNATVRSPSGLNRLHVRRHIRHLRLGERSALNSHRQRRGDRPCVAFRPYPVIAWPAVRVP